MASKIDATQIRRIFEEGINQMKLEVFDEIIAPNYVNHNMPTPQPGPDGLKAMVSMFMDAFPDFRVEVEEVISEGNYFASRGHFTGTHRAPFQGIPATGNSINAAYMDMWRAEDGKLVENWVNLDMVTMMRQLGVMPG